ncbi:oxidoreductase-like domain-containing protein [Pontibacterium sp.]|uniref:oxidoreductase-like domain-containing protein n=1 Tax=Pontibacterium sp. TaxID=2036026 RepID=UPI003565059D
MTANAERPVPPGDNECCEGGCSPCVWDHYHEAMRVWQEQQKAEKAKAQAELEKSEGDAGH